MFNNNYNYNPYYTQQPRYQSMEQYSQQPQNNMLFNGVQSRSVLNGKQVDSLEVVKAMDIPLDGSISYFPLTDGSAIISKQLQNDGTSKMVVYKASEEQQKELPKYVTLEELKKEINKIDLSEIDDFKEELQNIKKQLKDIKKNKGE